MRSQQRNRWVARRRLWWRWTLWAFGGALRWLALPAVAVGVAGTVLQWWSWDARAPEAVPTDTIAAVQARAPLASPQPAASDIASAVASEPAAAASDTAQLQLRLDAELQQGTPASTAGVYIQLPLANEAPSKGAQQ